MIDTVETRYRVAVHEAGHAVIARALGIRVERVWIAAELTAGEKGGAAEVIHGIAVHRERYVEVEPGNFVMTTTTRMERRTLTDLQNQLAVHFGGAAAEVVLFGGFWPAGCRDDVKNAAATAGILRRRREEPQPPPINLIGETYHLFESLVRDRRCSERTKNWMFAAIATAVAIVAERRSEIEQLAARLVERGEVQFDSQEGR